MSNVDPTVPVQGKPTTQSVRDNFSTIKTELEAFQSTSTTSDGAALVGYKHGGSSGTFTTSASARTVQAKLDDWVNARDFGFLTTNSAAANTTALQAALDNCPVGGTVFIPRGTYAVTSQDTYVFTLTNAVSIVGDGHLTTLRGDSVSNTTSMIGVNFSSNGGLTDVRNWRIENLRIFFNGGGLSCIVIYDGFPILTSAIRNCSLTPNNTNGGYAFSVTDVGNWAHSMFELNTLSGPVYLECGDGNTFQKNNSFASSNGPAYTLDLDVGIRNNIIRDNTIVCRDGALKVIDGTEIRFCNNQIEQFQTHGENQSTPAASVYIQGSTRDATNIIIEANNFGGGTNVDYSIYLDNAAHCVITKNNFIATDAEDIYCTANSQFCIFEFDNNIRETLLDQRNDSFFKVSFNNNSTANINMPVALTGANSWSDVTVYRNKDGMIVFLDNVSGGTTTAGTVMYTLPAGMRGLISTQVVPVVDSAGAAGAISSTAANGEIKVVSLASNNATYIPPVIRTATNTNDY